MVSGQHGHHGKLVQQHAEGEIRHEQGPVKVKQMVDYHALEIPHKTKAATQNCAQVTTS